MKKKKNKKGLEMIEIIIALAVLGTVAISISSAMGFSLKNNTKTVITNVDKSFVPVNNF